jgi:predicted nuclease with RNAse H fold
VRALGLDVAVRRGLDAVLMDEERRVLEVRPRLPLTDLPALLEETRPDAVAIDSPPGWAIRGSSRQTEREIRLFGIQSYGTPTEGRGRDHAFYEWMRVGFECFRMAKRAGFDRYGGGPAAGTALEVFPHASAVVLARCLPPRDVAKGFFRRRVLEAQGVHTRGLRSQDQLDAALAALTGALALRGMCTALGDPKEGVIVLPTRTLPARPYPRCRQAGGDGQVHLPGMSPCGCGDPACRALTAREFAPGHDAKRKSILWRLSREGHDAAEELRRRGWELPPEMR